MKKNFLYRTRLVRIFAVLLSIELVIFINNLENERRADEQFLLGTIALTFIIMFYVFFRFLVKRRYTCWFHIS